MIFHSLRRAPALAAAVLVSLPMAGHAVPFTTEVTIFGSVDFDDSVFAADPGASLSGQIQRRSGGVFNVANFDEILNPPPPILSGAVTDFGDGFGGNATAAIGFEQADAEAALGFDIVLDITNNRIADPITVTFKVDFFNAVNADGDSAVARSAFTVDDPGGEVFATSLTSDTVNGDLVNGLVPGTLGDALTDGPDSAFFDVIVPALTSVQVAAAYSFEGGAFVDQSGFAELDFDGFLSVFQVDGLGAEGRNLSAAGSAGLFLLLLAGLLVVSPRPHPRTRRAQTGRLPLSRIRWWRRAAPTG